MGSPLLLHRYRLVQAQVGPAFDTPTMNNARILDASIGPPYTPPALSSSSSSSSTSSPQIMPLPPVPNTGIVSSVTSRLFIGKEYGNYNGVLHGGAAGVIFDMLTTIALGPIARPGFWA